MGKTIKKTAIVTIAALIILSGLFYFLFPLISPKSASDIYWNFGNKTQTVKYSEKAYEKDKTFDNLLTLCDRAVWAENSEVCAAYIPKLLSDGEFKSYAENTDGSGVYSGSTIYYYACELVSAYCVLDLEDDALNAAYTYTTEYTAVNPLRTVMIEAFSENNKDFCNKIYNFFTEKNFDYGGKYSSDMQTLKTYALS